MKKTVLLMTVFLLILSLTLPAYAAEQTQDNLVISLTADAKDGSSPITAVLTVENVGEEAVTELELELLVPDGYVLAEGNGDQTLDTLDVGESVELTVVYQKEQAEVLPEEPTPETGDFSAVVLIILVAGAAVALIVGGKPMARRMLCVVICVAMLGGVVAMPAQAQGLQKKEAQISVNVTVDGEDLELSAVVRYLPSEADIDTDGDGIADYLEELLGSDPTDPDSDDDGIGDYDEIMHTDTNPTMTDTDGNGVADGDEDADGDGVSNLRELELGTSLTKTDTDSDGISDGQELELGLDPLADDTDGDGVADGYELELGTNPAAAESSFTISQSEGMASVNLELEGQQVNTLSIKAVNNEVLFPESIPGYMGQAYDFSVDGGFDTADISFSFDPQILADGAEPVIYYFNEETQTLEALETTVVDGVATTTVEHFSTYILLNRTVYDESFTWEDIWESTGSSGTAEVVLVIDDSASMSYFGDNNDPDNLRLTEAQNLIDELPDGAKIGVVRFASKTELLTKVLTSSKDTAKSFLTDSYFTSSGSYTYMYTAINEAMGLFETTDEDILRAVIVITDGYAHDYSSLHSSTVTKALNNGVVIMTVGLGDEAANATYLKTLAEATGGDYRLAGTASDLAQTIIEVNKSIDLNLDTDGDTIPDYYEDNMVTFNGQSIALDKYKKDTDGDGLADNKEIAIELVYNEDQTQVYVKGTMYSSPTLVDTDFDGTTDLTDGSPMEGSFSGVLTTAYATSNVDCEMDYRWFFGDNTVYNSAMSKVSILFAAELYAGSTLQLSDSSGANTTTGTSITAAMNYFGLSNVSDVSLSTLYSDKHLSEVAVGHRTVTYNGVTKTILAVAVRGTNGTIEEWSSNCDIGDLSTDTSTDDWVNTLNHKGFDIAAKRIERIVDNYISNQGLKSSQLVYWVTGHSRGAAIANIIGADLEDAGKTAFTITFAAPNTTLATNAASYKTIFNVINEDDFVPCLPMEAWGYTVYGRSTTTLSIRESFEKEWESTTGISNYNSDANNMDKCVAAIAAIMPDGSDPRVEGFRYTCSCHGDGSDDTITITNKGMSESSREGAIAKIPECALDCCIITRYDGGLVSGWNFDVCQTPAYLMQLLAAYMGGAISEYRFAVELNIADRYENAKTAIIAAGLSGIAHPHYFESYYVLANNVTAADFA